ncbi:MAG TPA: amidohydrolase family protein [Acidimicrobiia bacterium]|nr:amidohydrolase family protein [Acidimicrobiia bacterium]
MSLTAAEVRAGLDHPVIDADGHGIEYLPWFRDLLRDEGGPGAVDAWDVVENGARLSRTLDADTKRALGLFRVSWWGLPSENTLDRASAMLPALLHERLDELGIDVAVCYPTYGLTVMGLDDPNLRVAAARAFNTYYAQAYAGLRDRLEPVAIVPTYAPEEAIAVLEHAVETLGLRVVMCTGLVHRPLPGENLPRGARWVDALGLDSAHDYDPLWQRFVELDVTPTFHSTGMGWGSRTSPSSYVANHVGSFGAAGEALCRSLLLGGVMHRFPELRFAFLEGGVTWAATLCSDLVGHWEKRHSDAMGQYDPARLDRALLTDLIERYGADEVRARVGDLDAALHMLSEPDEDRSLLDEFAASGLRSPADIRETFARQCFFGCEADDPTWALAFAPEYHGTRLGAMFASDLGHWDVPDATQVLPEAWELVERGLVTTDAFRAFTHDHALELWGPKLFADTVLAPR